MFRVNENETVLEITFSSSMEFVNRVIRHICEFLEPFDMKLGSNANLVIREIVNNAVEHGNGNDNTKHVVALIEVKNNHRFVITVTDEGEGFDYESYDFSKMSDPDEERRRGLPLIYSFSDAMDFNEKGNEITVHISLVPETDFNVHEDENSVVIEPTGSLTSAVSEKLRELLYILSQKQYDRFVFNMKQVSDIDSISFSVLAVFADSIRKENQGVVLEMENMSVELMNLFTLTRMDTWYKIII